MKKKIQQPNSANEINPNLKHIWKFVSTSSCPETIYEYIHQFAHTSFRSRSSVTHQFLQLKVRPTHSTALLLSTIEQHAAEVFSISCAIKTELAFYALRKKHQRQFNRTFRKNEELWAEMDKVLQYLKTENNELYYERVVDTLAEEIPYTFSYTQVLSLFEAHDFLLN